MTMTHVLLCIVVLSTGLLTGLLMTVLLPNNRRRGTQVSCSTLRERRRPLGIGEVLAIVLD